MRPAITAVVLAAVLGCAGERQMPSDTSKVESPANAESSATSAAATARDSQATKATTPAKGATTRGSTTGTKRPPNPPDVRPDTPLYPTDTFGLNPRDTSVQAFLKKRPPEIRRPQNPQTTPR